MKKNFRFSLILLLHSFMIVSSVFTVLLFVIMSLFVIEEKMPTFFFSEREKEFIHACESLNGKQFTFESIDQLHGYCGVLEKKLCTQTDVDSTLHNPPSVNGRFWFNISSEKTNKTDWWCIFNSITPSITTQTYHYSDSFQSCRWENGKCVPAE